MSAHDQGRRPVRVDHLETLRTARFCVLGGESGTPAESWYVLHGYRQLARRFITRFRGLASPERQIVAPEGASRFYLTDSEEGGHSETVGASWMTREDRELEIRDYVRYLDRLVCAVESPPSATLGVRRVLLGFSQGAATAARWAALGRYPVTRLILWGSSLPPDLPERARDRLADTEVTLVRGREDPLRRAEDEAREEGWLEAAGVSFSVIEHGGSHELDPGVLEELSAEA